jgi:hypothetical protein
MYPSVFMIARHQCTSTVHTHQHGRVGVVGSMRKRWRRCHYTGGVRFACCMCAVARAEAAVAFAGTSPASDCVTLAQVLGRPDVARLVA